MVGVTGSIPVAPTIESSINLLFPGLFGAVRIVSAVCRCTTFQRTRSAKGPDVMPAYICTTCGTQYAPTPQPPASCPICLDERQYVTPAGQSWTTLDVLARRSMNAIRELEPNLISITTFPAFGINQRAQLLRTSHGNVLWDCIALVDRATVEMITAMGGLKSIA